MRALHRGGMAALLLGLAAATGAGAGPAAPGAAGSASPTDTTIIVAAPTRFAAAAAPAGSATDTARVTYTSGATIYIDAGSQDGLAIGARVRLVRGGTEADTLRVDHIASHRAACSRVFPGAIPAVGDLVRFVPVRTEEPSRAAGSPGSSRRRSGASDSWFRRNGLRGRVSLRHLAVNALDQDLGGFSQPAFDVKIEGRRVGGSDIDLSVDTRARRTYRSTTDGTNGEGQTRVYRLNVSRRTEGSGLRLSVGRQTSASLSTVSIFDGLLVEYAGSIVAGGVFAGSQPEAGSFGYSRQIMEYGAYGRWERTPAPGLRYGVNGGVISSYLDGRINRDYLFLNGQYGSRLFSAYMAQEVDVNRGWKIDAGEPRLSMTSAFANVQYRISSLAEIHASYDDRRNPRLYADRDTPESEFDDAYRRGWGAGGQVRFLHHFGVATDYRRSGDPIAGDVDSYTGMFHAAGLTPLGLDLGSRHTRYTGRDRDGWLHSVNAGGGFRSAHVRFSGGLKEETSPVSTATRSLTRWYGVDLDMGVARSLYLLLSVEATRGDVESNNQLYSSVSYLF